MPTPPSCVRPKSGLGQPGFSPARYTLDLLLPVANLHQREAFIPRGYAAWWEPDIIWPRPTRVHERASDVHRARLQTQQRP